MKIIQHPYPTPSQPIVATIGFFDGVHAGHRWLIDHLKLKAEEVGGGAAVITFDRHPREVLQQTFNPKLIDTLPEKLAKLAERGVELCYLLHFDLAMSQLSAHDFIAMLAHEVGVTHLFIGYDHRFGHGRSEGFEAYCGYGKELGIVVEQTPAHLPMGEKVSSSTIRRLLDQGDIPHANALLGNPFALRGVVVKGEQLGRTIGFPTANIAVNEPHKLIPAQGCYAVWVRVNGARYRGMLNVGTRPTVACSSNYSIEVHLLDFEGDLYGKELTIEFVSYLRPERKMGGLVELKAQLENDKEQTYKLLLTE